MYDLLKKITSAVGPTGEEGKVAEAILSEVAPFVDEHTIDAMGNLICVKKGKNPDGKKIMLSSHMDHIGFIVMDCEKEGYLRVACVGGIHVEQAKNRHVIFPNGVEGVISAEVTEKKPAFTDLYIDIGAESREEAMRLVKLGDIAVFAPDCYRIGENRVASPAMDDRCACALQARFLQTMGEKEDTVIAVFSTQEEVGCRGARAAAFAYEPDMGIAIDVTANGDTPGDKFPAITLGKGIAVKVMDRGSISNPALREDLCRCAEENNIPYQREILPFGGTDASAMQLARGGIPVCTLSLPCRNVHSPVEVIDMRDMDSGLRLLRCFIK